MRVARAAFGGMLVAAAVTVAAFSVAQSPAAAEMDMPEMPDMQMGTTCAWGLSLSVVAQDGKFDKDCLAAPPARPFTIAFDNREAVPHNIVILREHESTETLFRGEVITGPRSITYSVDRLPLGRYHFHCEVHPTLMMGTFIVGGTGAISAPAGMTMSSPPGMTMSSGQTVSTARGSDTARNVLLVLGIACCTGGLIVSRSRRARPRSVATEPAAVAAPTVKRRELVKLGAAGVAGAVVTKVATSAPAGAADRLDGVHISVLTQVVSPEPVKGFPHHWTLTVYGPDDALNGMGWGGATDLETQQDVFNSKMFPCIYSLTGSVTGDVVKLHGLMLFSGAPDQGLPVAFEGNLATGALHVNGYDTFLFDGTGVVARI